jgi:hypothetical protein
MKMKLFVAVNIINILLFIAVSHLLLFFLTIITTHATYTAKSICLIFVLTKIFLNTEIIFPLLKKMEKEHLQIQLPNLANMLSTEMYVTNLHRRSSW